MKQQDGLTTMQKLAFLQTTMTLKTHSWKIDAEKFDIVKTESEKRQPVMTHVAQISKKFMNQKCHQTCVQCLIKLANFVRDLKTAFLVGVECRKSDVKSIMP